MDTLHIFKSESKPPWLGRDSKENTFFLSAPTWMKKTVSYWLQMILNHKTITKTLHHFVSSCLLLFNYLSSSVENMTAASISLSSGRCHLLPVAIGNDYPKTPLINVFLHFMNGKTLFFSKKAPLPPLKSHAHRKKLLWEVCERSAEFGNVILKSEICNVSRKLDWKASLSSSLPTWFKHSNMLNPHKPFRYQSHIHLGKTSLEVFAKLRLLNNYFLSQRMDRVPAEGVLTHCEKHLTRSVAALQQSRTASAFS